MLINKFLKVLGKAYVHKIYVSARKCMCALKFMNIHRNVCVNTCLLLTRTHTQQSPSLLHPWLPLIQLFVQFVVAEVVVLVLGGDVGGDGMGGGDDDGDGGGGGGCAVAGGGDGGDGDGALCSAGGDDGALCGAGVGDGALCGGTGTGLLLETASILALVIVIVALVIVIVVLVIVRLIVRDSVYGKFVRYH